MALLELKAQDLLKILPHGIKTTYCSQMAYSLHEGYDTISDRYLQT